MQGRAGFGIVGFLGCGERNKAVGVDKIHALTCGRSTRDKIEAVRLPPERRGWPTDEPMPVNKHLVRGGGEKGGRKVVR
ncbi:MAG: hypothetical protein CL678_15720 [Bdellovibrionaceae bacterium]|nr:hypothetical protein [Pseudobdellovibrionaceae bacterium]